MPNVGTITGSMYLDPSAYVAGLNTAAGATRSFQQGVSTISFAGFNRGIFATTTLLYGLERIMSNMSKGMEEYANMLGRIGTVADLTAASVSALADSMKQISVYQGVSRKDIMGGMYTAAQAGYETPAEMRAMAASGARLSRASGKEIDVKKSVDLQSGIRQALGIGMGSVSSNRMNDILLRGRDIGRWELDEMAQALGIPLTVWGNQFAGKQSGEETLRQLLSVMSVASLAGVSPRMTATGTRRIVEKTLQLNKSGKVGDPLRNALRGAGFGGQEPILDALNQGGMRYLNTLMNVTGGGQTSELTRLGYGSRDLLVLTSALRGKAEKLNRTYEELSYGNAAGTTERYGEKMRQTYDYSRDRLRAQWEITSQQFMQASIPLIGQFTNMLEGFNKVAQALPESVKSFMLLIGALSAARLALNFLGFHRNLVGGAAGGVVGARGTGAMSPGAMIPTLGNPIFGGGNVSRFRGPVGVNARFANLPGIGTNVRYSPPTNVGYRLPPLSSGNIGAYTPASGDFSATPSSGAANMAMFSSGLPFYTPSSGRMSGTPASRFPFYTPSSGRMSGTPSSGPMSRTPSSYQPPRALSSGNIGAYTPSSGLPFHTPSSGRMSYTPTSYWPLSSGNIGAYTPTSGTMSGTPSSGVRNGGNFSSGLPFFTPSFTGVSGTPSSLIPRGFGAYTGKARSVYGYGGQFPAAPYMPRGFGAYTGKPRSTYGYNTQGNVFSGVGRSVASGIGMYAGSMIGNRMEGENGNGLLPMMMGMGGMSLADNGMRMFTDAYSKNPAALATKVRNAWRTTKIAAPTAIALSVMQKAFDPSGWQMPMNAGEEGAMDEGAMMRKRSSNPAARLMSNVWQSLSALGSIAAGAPGTYGAGESFSESWGADQFSRIWGGGKPSAFTRMIAKIGGYEIDPGVRSGSAVNFKDNLFNQGVWNKLPGSARKYLVENKMTNARSLLADEGFGAGFKEQFGADAWKQLNDKNLAASDPTKWTGLLLDGIKTLSAASEEAKAKTKALAESEKALGNVRSAEKAKNMRPYLAFTSGFETLQGLEGMQKTPFAPEKSARWEAQYAKALGVYNEMYRTTGLYDDESLRSSLAGFGDKLGKGAKKDLEAPIKDTLKWNERLRGMGFLANAGKSLAGKGDEELISNLNLDRNMDPRTMQSVLGRVRGLDYTNWTQTFAPPQAPFSQALQYGTKEGYNATLERRETDPVVTIMGQKLQGVIDTIVATESANDEKQRQFERVLETMIDNAASKIVDAIDGRFPDVD